MFFNKIELRYKLNIFKYKVKFSETRKPTLPEFLILSILLNHPDKENSLKEILNNDFRIENTSLFVKNLKELLSSGIISFNKLEVGIGVLDENIPIKLLDIDNSTKKSFKEKKYIISESIKTKELFFVNDPIQNLNYISDKLDIPYKIKSSNQTIDIKHENNKLNISFDDVLNMNKNYILENVHIFGNDATLIELLNDKSVILNLENLYIERDIKKIANEISLNIVENSFKINSNVKPIVDYVENNSKIYNFIIDEVVNFNNKKIDEIYNFELDKNFENYNNNLENANSQVFKNNWDVILVNMANIKSINTFLEKGNFVSNINTLIAYNSSKFSEKFSIINKKEIVFFEDEIKDEMLLDANFIMGNSDSEFFGFKIFVDKIGKHEIYGVRKTKINLISKISQLIETNALKFTKELDSEINSESIYKSNEKLLANIILITNHFTKLNFKNICFDIWVNYFEKNFSLDDLENIYNNLNFENKKVGSLWNDIFKYLLQKHLQLNNPEILVEIMQKLNISKRVLIEILESATILEGWQNTVNTFKEFISIDIDIFEKNYLNSISNMNEVYSKKLVSGVFDNYNINSEQFQKIKDFYDIVGNMTSKIYRDDSFSSYLENSDDYSEIIDSLQKIIIEDLDNFIFKKEFISTLKIPLNYLYKVWYEMSLNFFKNLDKNTQEYKNKYIAWKYLEIMEKKIDKYLLKNNFEEDLKVIELKIFYIKKIMLTDIEFKILFKNKDHLIFEALKIVYGNKSNKISNIIKEIMKELGV